MWKNKKKDNFNNKHLLLLLLLLLMSLIPICQDLLIHITSNGRHLDHSAEIVESFPATVEHVRLHQFILCCCRTEMRLLLSCCASVGACIFKVLKQKLFRYSWVFRKISHTTRMRSSTHSKNLSSPSSWGPWITTALGWNSSSTAIYLVILRLECSRCFKSTHNTHIHTHTHTHLLKLIEKLQCRQDLHLARQRHGCSRRAFQRVRLQKSSLLLCFFSVLLQFFIFLWTGFWFKHSCDWLAHETALSLSKVQKKVVFFFFLAPFSFFSFFLSPKKRWNRKLFDVCNQLDLEALVDAMPYLQVR